MEREQPKEMMKTKQGDVERNKAVSKLCLRLFPLWCKPPTQGELQNLIIKSWGAGLENDEAIKRAGNWWLWLRSMIIENTFTKQAKSLVLDMAVSAASTSGSIHFVSTRSPELLHSQVGNGDPTLPRSRKALRKLKEIIDASSTFLPTSATVAFADLAVDNLPAIEKVCSVPKTVEKNLVLLESICSDIKFSNCRFIKMSQLTGPRGKLEGLIEVDGKPKTPIGLDDKAKIMIEIANRESMESQQRMFGWTTKQSVEHNLNLGITMGLVGEAVKRLEPPPIMIHNEAFIARGQLNNIFNPANDPLPVICLADLLESKNHK